MEELSLHILDIAENSIAAGAGRVEIRVREDRQADRLWIEIADDGRGMSETARKTATDPFYTTRTTRRVGLGLALLEQAAQAACGELQLESRPGAGTRVTAVFQRSHVDRQPLGDMAGTLLTLVVGNPQVEFVYSHEVDGSEVTFDTAEMEGRQGAAGIAALRKRLEKIREHGTGNR
jgi:anti-sigma regulatory factor (Ser/Thr protein kinase)